MFMPRAFAKIMRTVRGGVSSALLKRACQSVGEGTRFHHDVWVMEPSVVAIGKQTLVCSGARISSELPGQPLRIGDHVQINSDVKIDHTGGLAIGDNVLISEGVIIYTHDHGLDPHSIPRPVPKRIDSDVWIGARAIILPSCTHLGQGAIIGAGSVVSKDVAANTIVAGNPARFIRARNEA
jgi:acetyltransferase-like isoleucine patch superfamily enzyme